MQPPDFNMHSPPTRLVSPKSQASSQPSSPVSARSANSVAIAGTTATSAAATTGTSQNTLGRGQIHVKLIQARGLAVRSSATSRPYVVVQFEQNEFVSREPTAVAEKEIKGTAISRTSSSTALSALGAIESKVAAHAARRAGVKTPGHSPASSVSSSLAPPTNGAGIFGRLNASNPMWKHEVSLYVILSFPRTRLFNLCFTQ